MEEPFIDRDNVEHHGGRVCGIILCLQRRHPNQKSSYGIWDYLWLSDRKYHWFREHVKSGLIKSVGIDTKDQLPDIFTKGLAGESFSRLRRCLVGW